MAAPVVLRPTRVRWVVEYRQALRDVAEIPKDEHLQEIAQAMGTTLPLDMSRCRDDERQAWVYTFSVRRGEND